MDKEAFRNRMQQYKQARDNNPQLKYWDWKGYADGGIVDEDPSTSERPIKNFNPKGDPRKVEYSYNPGAGFVKDVFDLYDAPVIGDALGIYDASKALYNKDYLGAGLAAATILGLPRAANKIKREIPTVNRKFTADQINNILRKDGKLGPDIQTLQKESDWNNLINREIERIYDPQVRSRAKKIDNSKGTQLEYYYDDLHNNYTNNYESLPKARIVDELSEEGERAAMRLTPAAQEALITSGKAPSWGDFEMAVRKDVPLDPQLARHEIAHFNQYMNNGNGDLNRLPYGTDKKSVMRQTNPLDPNHTDYFSNIGEQSAYQLNIITEMQNQNIPVTQKNYINFVKRLSDKDSRKKAVEQFNTYKDAYKWTKHMPLVGLAGYSWINNNEE